MKVLILSDLHLEFAPFEPVPDLEFDVVVLAGDIHSPAKRAIQWAADRFHGKPVTYLLGNHEYYDGLLDTTLAEARREAEGTNAFGVLHIARRNTAAHIGLSYFNAHWLVGVRCIGGNDRGTPGTSAALAPVKPANISLVIVAMIYSSLG